MKIKVKVLPIILYFIIILLASSCNNKVVLNEGEQAVRILSGKVNEVIKEPGIIKKLNSSEKIIIYPKSNQTYYTDKMIIPSKDKVLLYFKFKMVWNIIDPSAFYKTFESIKKANDRFSSTCGRACRMIIYKTDYNKIKIEFKDKNKIINDNNSSILNEILKYAMNYTEINHLRYYGINIVGIELIEMFEL